MDIVWYLKNNWWKFLIMIVIIIAVLAFFNYKASAEASNFGKTVRPTQYTLTQNGELRVKLKSGVGAELKIWTISAKVENGELKTAFVNTLLPAMTESDFFTVSGLGSFKSGRTYSTDLIIVYGSIDMNMTSDGKISVRAV